MFAKKNNGSVLLKLGLVLVVLAAAGYLVMQRLQGTARVKLAERQVAVDAVTGSVSVDADGGTRELTSDLPGRVLQCDAIDQGRLFKEKDVLVQLDDSEMRRALTEAERQYQAGKERARFTLTGGKPELLAVPNLTDAEREKIVRENYPDRKRAQEKLEDLKRLLKLGNVAEKEVQTVERMIEDLDRELKLKLLDEKKGDEDFVVTKRNAELQIEKMAIKAPSDGQIDAPFTHRGALIGGGVRVATWFSNQRVVAAKISEESFGKVKIGQKARLRLLTYGHQEFDATVSKLLPKADEAQRFTVFLDVAVEPERKAELLKPGSTGEVTITVAERPNQVMIQRRAIFDSDKVYVVNGGRVELRKVKVGFLALNVAEILEGVKEGEQVIVDNLYQFRDGQRVSVEVVK